MSQFKTEVLQSIVTSGEKWVPINRISELTQCPPDIVLDCLADLQTDGMIDVWESDEGLFIKIIGDVPSPIIMPEKSIRVSRQGWQGVQRFDQYALPYPTVLLGAGTALWDNVQHAVCPGCGNRELKLYEYCLRCDAWGGSTLMERVNNNVRSCN